MTGEDASTDVHLAPTDDGNHQQTLDIKSSRSNNNLGKTQQNSENEHRNQGNEKMLEENPQDYIPTPPDGGWGWVIVLASLVCNLLVDGIGYSFGVFLLEFVEAYKASKSKVSLVGSLTCGIYLFVGPIVSAMINKFGCRPVVIAGSVISAIAFVLATVSPNIDVLTVTYGFMGGFGLGMMYLPSVVMVGFYFDTKRAFATGLAVCGSGLGTFIFPPLSEFLLREFSWQGGVLIIGGIMLQGCVCGTLMRPLEAKPPPIKSIDGQKGDISELSKTSHPDNHTLLVSPVDPNRRAHSTDDATVGTETNKVQELYNELLKRVPPEAIAEFAPLLEVPAPVVRHGDVPTGSLRSLHLSKQDLARPLYRKDIFYSGSVSHIPEFRSQPNMKSYITSVTKIPAENELQDVSRCSCLPRPSKDVLTEMLDLSLLADVSFLLILLGNFTAFLGMYVPFVFLVDRAILLGLQRSQATFLISVIGISNTAARIVIGKVADMHFVDSLVITYISVAIMGLATGLVPFCNTYATITVAAAVFGLGMAAFISLSSIIICDRMGLEKLTNAFGLLTLFRGAAGIAGPPVAGFMFDSSGSYDMSFYIGGLLLLAGAFCLCLLHIPALSKSTRRYREDISREISAEKNQDVTKSNV